MVENYYNTQLNLFSLANQSYNEFCDNNVLYPLRNNQLNYSVGFNKFIGEISVASSYDNRSLIPVEFQSLDYSINFKPALNQIRSMPLVAECNGDSYYTVFLGYKNRCELGIQGRCVAACSGDLTSVTNAIKNLVNSNLLAYGSTNRIFLDKNFL